MIRVDESAIIDRPVDQVWALLRDFNGHDRWHPAIRESHMQGGAPSDRIGGVRDFRLASGERVCERLIRMSDRTRSLTYTITRSDVPLSDYVAHVELKPVTEGNRTFWRWHSKFNAPRGREAEMRALVAEGVYRAGFEGARAFLGTAPSAPEAPAQEGAIQAKAIVARRHGGPEVLAYEDVPAPPPGPGEVRIRQTAIGVNYIDVYTRTGYFNLIQPPAVPGMEAAGVVTETGPGVAHLKEGDRVVYACAPPGAYASVRTMPADLVVPLPRTIDDRTAAAMALKGITAFFLLNKVHRLERGETALIFAPAGGVGRILVQWARAMGATVIGATSSPDKARAAREAGAHQVVMPGERSLEDQVRALTDGRGADVAFDAVGRDTFDHTVAALKPTGHLVSFGQASGDIGMRNVSAFAGTSLTLSRPNYGHYTDTRAKVTEALDAVWAALASGAISAHVGQTFPLARAAEAHRALEDRQTQGSTLLIPEGTE